MEDSESLNCDCPVHGKPVVDFTDTLNGVRLEFGCGCKGNFTAEGLVELDSESLAKVIPIRPEVVVSSKRPKEGDAVLWKKKLWRVEYIYGKENKGNAMLSNNESGDKMAPIDELEYVAKDTLSPRYTYQEPWDSQFRRSSTSSSGGHKPSRYFSGSGVERRTKAQPPPPADSIDTASLIQSEVRRLEKEDKEDKADTRKLVTKPPSSPTTQDPPAAETPTTLPKRRGDW